MRDFFIRSLELVINVAVVLVALGIVFAAVSALTGHIPGVDPMMGFLGILMAGGLYLVVMAGFIYLGLGIYQNTKRMADLLESLQMESRR